MARTIMTCLVGTCFLLIGVLMSPGHAASTNEGATVGNPTPQASGSAVVKENMPGVAGDTVQPGSVEPPPSPEAASTQERVREALMRQNFAYSPVNMLDPFVPFITGQEPTPQPITSDEDEGDLPPIPRKPLTPLQKMSLAEIERGLRAITWGGMGRRAVIEDSAGKGYIVSVGTPAGDKNGMITEIFNDRLVIQQEVWDRNLKRMVPFNAVVKLKKEEEKKQ